MPTAYQQVACTLDRINLKNAEWGNKDQTAQFLVLHTCNCFGLNFNSGVVTNLTIASFKVHIVQRYGLNSHLKLTIVSKLHILNFAVWPLDTFLPQCRFAIEGVI